MKTAHRKSPSRFNVNARDARQIGQICERFERLCNKYGLDNPGDRMFRMMDLAACHSAGCPLDLAALLAADEFDFIHDVAGIHRHINRNTGELAENFLPRCAAESEAAA